MGVRVLTHKVVSGGMRNLSYVVVDDVTRDAVIVDPAWEPDTLEATLRAEEARLVGVLLTHSHYDHVNLADLLVRRSGAPAVMSRAEVDFYRYRGLGLEALETFSTFWLGSLPVTPLLTPGHTKGSVCYRIGDHLFTGDTLFCEGCGICMGPGGSAEEMFQSLQLLKARVPGTVRIHPGHSFGQPPGPRFDELLKNNIYLAFTSVDPFVRFRNRPGQKGLMAFV